MAKVDAPEESKRHQTYYDSESTPPKQRSIADTLVSACYTETNRSARPKTSRYTRTCGSKETKKTMAKLEAYAGQGASREAFLAKFESQSRYFGWTVEDRLFQLQNSLTGSAATVL